jgi:hypothetical protein
MINKFLKEEKYHDFDHRSGSPQSIPIDSNSDDLGKREGVAILAGRRLDQTGSKPQRFPLDNLEHVKQLLRKTFLKLGIGKLICSAACGADLLAIEVALRLQIETHIILPFEKDMFKQQSVTDRPGDWGAFFDRLMNTSDKNVSVRILGLESDSFEAYIKTNNEIIAYARDMANKRHITSIVVWDGDKWGEDDITYQFIAASQQAGFYTVEVPTLY